MTTEISCSTCRYANKSIDEEPCKKCARAYTDKWEPLTEEQKEWRKQAIDDFMAEALEHIPCYTTGGKKIRETLRKIQAQMEIEDYPEVIP